MKEIIKLNIKSRIYNLFLKNKLMANKGKLKFTHAIFFPDLKEDLICFYFNDSFIYVSKDGDTLDLYNMLNFVREAKEITKFLRDINREYGGDFK